jgi:hypothetical protein
LAAVLANKVPVVGKTIGIIATGGNLDVAKFAKVRCASLSSSQPSLATTGGNLDVASVRQDAERVFRQEFTLEESH